MPRVAVYLLAAACFLALEMALFTSSVPAASMKGSFLRVASSRSHATIVEMFFSHQSMPFSFIAFARRLQEHPGFAVIPIFDSSFFNSVPGPGFSGSLAATVGGFAPLGCLGYDRWFSSIVHVSPLTETTHGMTSASE
jgi:hypothetical protein